MILSSLGDIVLKNEPRGQRGCYVSKASRADKV